MMTRNETMQTIQHKLPETEEALQDIAANPRTTRPLAEAESAAQSAVELATMAAHKARGLLENGQAVAAEGIAATTRWVEEVARDKPLRSLGMVAVAGVIVGLLIGRR